MSFKAAFEKQIDQVFSNNKYWIHIAIWTITIGILVYFAYSSTIQDQDILPISNINKAIKTDVVIKGLLIGILISAFVVYSLLLFIIPYARYKQKSRYFIGSFIVYALIGFICFIIYIVRMVKHIKNIKDNLENDYYKVEVVNELVQVLCIFIFPVLIINIFFQIYFFINLYQQQYYLNKYKNAVELKTVAELNFLKSQINPHFLFNSLNNIYALSMQQPQQAANTAQKLKNLFQYVVNDSKQEVVPLSKEIQFLKDYIDLESVRNQHDKLDIQFKIFGSTDNLYIAPLLLVNFYENAFKHGIKAQITNSFLHSTIEIIDNNISLHLLNSYEANEIIIKPSIQNTGGIGLRNIRRRLEILYPNKFSLQTNKSANQYLVILKMSL